VVNGFLGSGHRSMLLTADTGEGVLSAFEAYEPPSVVKWVEREDI